MTKSVNKIQNRLQLLQSRSSPFELCHSFGIRYLSFFISNFMKMLILTIAVIASTVFATEEKKEGTPINSSNEVAVIKTNQGDMVVQFWSDAAPNTVENFKKLARQGFYDGTIFHRIVKGFMIQGGDPNSKDPAKENSYGQGGPGYNIKAEFNDHGHERGVVSMARGPDPDSAGSQFFICLAAVHRLDHQYTTFGKLIKGDDVLEKIGDVAVTRNSVGEMSQPTKRVVIESIKLVPADSVK
jgi:peptidyl-prolyl cis-trans isomerase B (cyclophilin B)